MLLTKEFQLDHFTCKYQYVIQLQSAFNDTFLFASGDYDKPNLLSHVDKKGSIIKTYTFAPQLFKFVMTSDHSVVLILPQQNQIWVINLHKHEKIDYKPRRFPFPMSTEINYELNCFFFEQTKLLCLVEKYAFKIGWRERSQISIKYMKTPLVSAEPIAIHQLQLEHNYFEIRKVDNCSSIVIKPITMWYKTKLSDLQLVSLDQVKTMKHMDQKMFEFVDNILKKYQTSLFAFKSVCHYNHNALTTWFSERKGVFRIKKMVLIDMKDLYMQMLFHLHQDFDDDLLFDCIQVLTQEY